MSINNSQQISNIKTMLVKGMNGEGIESIEKTATEGFIDTYTITYTDGTKTTFDVTNGNWGIWTSAVTAAQGATSVTINNDSIVPTSILEVYSQNASGTVITVNDIDVTPGIAVLTFPALAEATDFILHIVNGTASGGGGGGGTSDYPDLTNKPQINGVTLVGNKPSSDFGLINTFQGTIAEWNQLTTAEKKAYDHASIPDSLDGNVTFPASKVMLNSGDSVEGAMLKAIEIPYSAFTWDSASNRFKIENYTPTVEHLLGYLVTWENGAVASMIYHNTSASYLVIGGIIAGGAAITSNFQFKCFEIGI